MKKGLILIVIALFTGFLACRKEMGGNSATLQIRLTDAPAVYDSVIVDIVAVMVHSDQSGWVSMNMPSPGRYNLLQFTNGMDTLIASATLPVGKVSQIRLILGSNNSVTKNGIVYPLKVPSGSESGLKLQIHKDLVEGVTNIIQLDFDAARSVVETGNGNFLLKPVIRAIATGIDGSIKGAIQPYVPATALAFAGNDTFSAVVSTSGGFLISGVPTGTYTVCIYPDTIYPDTCISNVTVSVNQQTDIGTIVF